MNLLLRFAGPYSRWVAIAVATALVVLAAPSAAGAVTFVKSWGSEGGADTGNSRIQKFRDP
jgi:hypothetical protein